MKERTFYKIAVLCVISGTFIGWALVYIIWTATTSYFDQDTTKTCRNEFGHRIECPTD